MKEQLLAAVRQVAAQQGRDPNQLLAELLRGHLQQQQPPPVEVLPPEPRPPPVQMHVPQRFAGVPPPRREEDIDALMRYLDAESGAGGVFNDGGMSGGGVFGHAPVATAGFDPGAEQRQAQVALARAAPQLLAALQGAVQRPPPPRPIQARPVPQMMPQPRRPQQGVRMVVQTVYYEGDQPMPTQPVLPPWWQR